MLAAHVKRGVKAGLVAGLAFGLFVALVASPLVAFADDPGHGEGHATDDHAGDRPGTGSDGTHGESAVSMAVTNGVSVLSGVLWGVLLGGVVFGIAYYFLEPAIPGTGATRSYVLAGAGFVTVSGAPWLVLPPRPPGVEGALAVEARLVLYGGMMVAGALVCLLSGVVYARLRGARGRTVAAAVAVLPFGLLAVPAVLAPGNAVESPLPPEVTAAVTGTVVFGQALLWLLLAGTHARLYRRARAGRAPGDATPDVDAAVTAD